MTKAKKTNLISKTFNNFFINPLKEEVRKEVLKTSKKNEEQIEKIKSENLQVLKEFVTKIDKPEDVTSQLMAMNINPATFNSRTGSNIKDKPEGGLNPLVLRNFSIDYPIARACIDYIKNKTTHLDWDIVKLDEENGSGDDNLRKMLYDFFSRPYGSDSSMRSFQEQIIEDYLVMGSISLEKLKTRGGKLLGLLPVDVSTIKVRVDESGRIPEPPEIAFEQWILGTKTAELTKNDLIFRIRNARSNTIFGLSPLESLIIQVQSALAGSLFNWKFFTDSNQVEGFIEVPQDWTKQQVQEFQSYFDSLVSGDPRYQRRLKFLPSGMKYTSTKNVEDMSFERFEMWLLQQTCAVFGVPPQSLGFTNQINKATAQVQEDVGQERVGVALQNFLEELFTHIINYDLGFSEYKFKFVNVDPVDLKQEAEVDDIKIRSGVLSVDEVRARNGLQSIGLDHYIMTSSGPVFVKDFINGTTVTSQNTENNQNTQDNEQKDNQTDEEGEDSPDSEDLQRKELAQWKKFCINSIKRNKPIGDFKTYHIDIGIEQDIREQLTDVNDKASVVKVFQPYLSGDYKVILNLRKMLNELNKIQVP